MESSKKKSSRKKKMEMRKKNFRQIVLFLVYILLCICAVDVHWNKEQLVAAENIANI